MSKSKSGEWRDMLKRINDTTIEKNQIENQLSIFDLADTGYTRVTIKFKTKVPTNAHIIAEAFGIGDGHITEISDVLIPNDFTVLYITGESGSGKTTILNKYAESRGYKMYQMSDEEKNTPLFMLGDNWMNTIRTLTSVGISDAVLWMNTFNELSDSQQARCLIAFNMMKTDVVVVDEFLSTLDRETALPVAYSVQKAIRKAHKRLIVATAHMDLENYLMPDVVIQGSAFPSRWKISRKNVDNSSNPVVRNIVFSYGTKEDYRNADLGELHYKGKYTGGTKEYLFAYHNERLVALLVSTYNMHTGGRRISRVVVHPSYRGCGVGQAIVKKYISDFKNTDVLASMATINPVFEKAGMMRVRDTDIKPPSGIEKKLAKKGFKKEMWGDKSYLEKFTSNTEVREIIADYADKASAIVCPGGVRVSKEEVAKKILLDETTAMRVLFSFRPRKMARYIVPKEKPDD